MTSTEARPDLETVFALEIPCNVCSRPARLRGLGHGCVPPDPPPYFKCLGCWQKWYARVYSTLSYHGSLECRDCGGVFDSVESFNDYREF